MRIPKCEAIIVSKDVGQDAHGLHNITGIVPNHMTVSKIGQHVGPFGLYVALSDVLLDGTADLGIEIVHFDKFMSGDDDARCFKLVAKITGKIAAPNVRTQVAIKITPKFVKSGMHQIRISWGNNGVDTTSFFVQSKEEMNRSQK